MFGKVGSRRKVACANDDDDKNDDDDDDEANNADINEWYSRPAAAGKIKSALVNDFA